MLKRTLITTLLAVIIGIAVLIILLPSPSTAPEASKTAETDGLLIENVRLFDGETVQEKVDILVEDGLITEVGLDLSPEGNFDRQDMAGKTIIPGLIDAHTHTYGAALTTSLRFGVTTNLDMFMVASLFATEKGQRDDTAPTMKADLFSAATLATVDGGHGTQYGFPIDTLDDVESVPAWVDARVAEGADYIKLVYIPRQNRIPSLSLETATALIEQAHARGLKAVAHISTQRAAEEMVKAGVDGLVHLFADQEVSDLFIAKAAERDVFIIPTLAVIASVNGRRDGNALASDPMISPYLQPGQAESLGQAFGTSAIPGYDLDLALANVGRLHAGGVTILAGTDAPNPGTLHGASLHQELAYYTEAGFSPLDALRSATAAPADAFGLPHNRGRLIEGARADFLVLNANPLEDIKATRDIAAIYKNGAPVARMSDSGAASNASLPADLGRFEAGIDAPGEWQWIATDDSFMGGKSTASITHSDESGGVLSIAAEIKPGFPFPWGGAMLTSASADQTAYSAAEFQTLSFRAKGTPGTYRVMMFTTDAASIPPTQTFTMTDTWAEVSLSIDGFPGLDPAQLTGIAIVTDAVPGDFQFQIDDVTLDPA